MFSSLYGIQYDLAIRLDSEDNQFDFGRRHFVGAGETLKILILKVYYFKVKKSFYNQEKIANLKSFIIPPSNNKTKEGKIKSIDPFFCSICNVLLYND